MLEKIERVYRKIPDKNYRAGVSSNSIINRNIRTNYTRIIKSNNESFSSVLERYYRIVDLIRMTLDKGVEVDIMRCEIQNM